MTKILENVICVKQILFGIGRYDLTVIDTWLDIVIHFLNQ